jgi:NADH:ubiquinone oxidoreductase subunit 2 (subunit N)
VNGAEFVARHADALLVYAPMAVGAGLTILPWTRVAAAMAALLSLALAVLVGCLVALMLSGAPAARVDAVGVGAGLVLAVTTSAGMLAALAPAAAGDPRSRPIALGLALIAAGAASGLAIERDVARLAILAQTAMLAVAGAVALGADRDRRAALAAFGGAMTSLAAGALCLAGAGYIFAGAGAFDLSAAGARIAGPEGDAGIWFGAALTMAGLAAFAGLAPLHAGAADLAARSTREAAPIAAIVLRLGAFVAFVRVFAVTQQSPQPGVAAAFSIAVAALGVVSVIAGAIQAIGAADARRLAAHALTAQFGCGLIGLAAGADDGAIAALFVVAAGAMTSLALVTGASAARHEDRPGAPMAMFDGLGRTRPLVGAALAVAAFGLTGAPLTAGFLGKWLSVEAALAQGWYWAATAIVTSSFAAVFVAGQLVERLYFRASAGAPAPPRGALAFAPALLLSVVATLVVGWTASAPLDVARMAARALAPTMGHAP